jgi:hypothetical protein
MPMNTLDERQLQTHIPVAGWLLIVSNAIFLLIGAFVFLLLVGIGLTTGEAEGAGVLLTVGTLVGLLLAALSIPGIAAGVGLLMRKTWGRILAIVVAILSLGNVPIGTAIGAYVLFVLLQEGAAGYFGPCCRS